MQTANSLQRNVGSVTGKKEINNLFNLSRTSGMGTEELSGIAGTFRGAATTGKGADLQENINKTRELYKQAMVSALDTSGAIKYMQVTSNMTDKIANEGSADTESIKDTLSSLALSSDFYKANASRGAAAFTGAEGFFKSGGGTGLALRSMQGMKGESGGAMGPMEMLATQSRGFSEEGGMGAQGLKAITKQVASVMGVTQENWSKTSKSSEAKFGAENALRTQFGISATNAKQLLEATMSGKLDGMDKNKISGLMEKEGDKEKDKTNGILDSVDMSIKENERLLQDILMNIGDKLVPSMTNIEGILYRFANKFLGGDSALKTTQQLEVEADQAKKEAAESKGKFSNKVASFFGGGADENVIEKMGALTQSKMREGKETSPEELDSLRKSLNLQGKLTWGDATKSKEEYGKSREETLTGAISSIDKDMAAKKTSADYDHLNVNQKKSFDESVSDEAKLRQDTIVVLNKLHEFLNKKPAMDVAH
jgi:hypothetical protein